MLVAEVKSYVIAAAAGVALSIAAVSAWNTHGSSRYRSGYQQAQADAETQRLREQEAIQYERDRADAVYRGTVLARDAALADLAGVRGQLDRVLRTTGRDPANPTASHRPDDSGPDWIGGFAACYGEYAELAEDAAGWADQVNGLQGYVRSINPITAR